MKQNLYNKFKELKEKIDSEEIFCKKIFCISNNLHHFPNNQKNQNKFLFSNDYSNFSDDKTKIIFSNYFRKLAYKTQVFFNNFGDYNRTRLTHSLEVSEISKTICKFLGLSYEISECISLSHDLGHTPFGHSGEDGLNIILNKLNFENFNHNVQSVKIVSYLEKKYSKTLGLNLDPKIIDSLIKHNGSLLNQKNYLSQKDLNFLEEICQKLNLNPNLQTHLEGQIASISDDIAYTNHDLEDGFRAGFIKISDLQELPIIKDFLIEELKCDNKKLSKKEIIYNLISYLTNFMIFDCLENFFQNIKEKQIQSLEEILNLDYQIFGFSPFMKESRKIIKEFLFKNFYKNSEMTIQSIKMQKIIQNLFLFYFENPSCLPLSWKNSISNENDNKIEIITNFIAGMTDRFAFETHKKIFL